MTLHYKVKHHCVYFYGEANTMKYEKATTEVVKFDFAEFMTGSGQLIDGKCTNYSWGGSDGKSCGDYTQGVSCSSYSLSGGAQAGYSCGTYAGSKDSCTGFTVNGSDPQGSVAFGCHNF